MSSEIRPVLNPILALKRDPRRESVTGRSVTEAHIRNERLDVQREVLVTQLDGIRRSADQVHAGRLLVAVRMFDDSLAPTHEPKAIFRESLNSELVAPVHHGYLAQVKADVLDELSALIKNSNRIDVRVAISRIERIATLTSIDVLGSRESTLLWQAAIQSEQGRVFTACLAPYFDVASRESVVRALLSLQSQGVISPLNGLVSINREIGSDADQLQLQNHASANSIALAAREYRQKPFTRLQIALRDHKSLEALIASGAVFRIDPVRPLVAAEVPAAPDPVRPMPDEQWQPIVGVIDGGLFARSYEPMVAWRAPSLVADVVANRAHGNQVGSLVVHGASWNTHLNLPQLTCRIGVAQAIAQNGHGLATRPEFQSYLRSVVARHCGETKVWNFSFNEPVDGADRMEMSELGHEIHKIAREFNILPVISIGNVDQTNNQRLCPPSDCEAALTVSGRVADDSQPGEACLVCLPGPGPEGLMKPELSWFSTLRTLGGAQQTGSSYATAITSALAAHTFHNLKAPTPDLVRALLINTAERDVFDRRLGWGSPCIRSKLPWECSDGSVTLVWTSTLRAGQWHYWEEIPIPPELIHAAKLRGRVALTAVLRPKVSELGSANYFSTRLQVALQYAQANGRWGNLAGSMREDTDPELEARADLAKWNPIRHHVKEIPNGRAFKGNTLRVCARVFGRDLYQFGLVNNSDIEASSVAFSLTLSAHASNTLGTSIYNSVTTRLGTYVESAVNDIEVTVEH